MGNLSKTLRELQICKLPWFRASELLPLFILSTDFKRNGARIVADLSCPVAWTAAERAGVVPSAVAAARCEYTWKIASSELAPLFEANHDGNLYGPEIYFKGVFFRLYLQMAGSSMGVYVQPVESGVFPCPPLVCMKYSIFHLTASGEERRVNTPQDVVFSLNGCGRAAVFTGIDSLAALQGQLSDGLLAFKLNFFFLVLHDAFSSRFFKTNVLFLYSFFSSTYISFMFPVASFSGVLFSLASFSS